VHDSLAVGTRWHDKKCAAQLRLCECRGANGARRRLQIQSDPLHVGAKDARTGARLCLVLAALLRSLFHVLVFLSCCSTTQPMIFFLSFIREMMMKL